MIIVLGHLVVAAPDRDEQVRRSQSSVRAARSASGCLDFSVSADPVDPTRVNVAERWTDRAALDRFRTQGGADEDTDDPFASILEFHVDEYEL